MRRPEYLSPSALSSYTKDESEYYMRYLAENRPPKMPQTQAMAVGSAFDAYIKSYLHKRLRGDRTLDPRYDFKTIFEAQVEVHNRAFAMDAGRHVFDAYVATGCASDLLLRFANSLEEPRFEFEVRGTITVDGVTVPLLGKPDVRFCCKVGPNCLGVIDDFKVNGYCGRGNTSPKKGYIQCVSENGQRAGMHRDVIGVQSVGGCLHVNTACNMEDIDEDWAAQLSTYAWLMGEEVGGDFIVGIQQIVADCRGGGRPKLRFATHCNRVGKPFQFRLAVRYAALWSRIIGGWSDAVLEDRAKLISSVDPNSLEGFIVNAGRTS